MKPCAPPAIPGPIQRANPASPRAARGFTLVEVMVALSITAIALVAGLKATAALTDNAQRQSQLLLAQLCAENRMIELRLARQLPGIGDSSSDCQQARHSFSLHQNVRATPNPYFRRVDVEVSEQNQSIVRLTTIVGRN